MKIYLKDGNYTLAKDFPMNVFEIRDTLVRAARFRSGCPNLETQSCRKACAVKNSQLISAN